jgi:F-type H+-transporting ATPase subunit epsilon
MDLEVKSVLVPGSEGDFQVFADHSPVMSTIKPGVIRVDQGDGKEEVGIFVRGGFAEITHGSLVILAEEAVPIKELSKSDLQQRIKDAEEDLEDAKTDEDRRKAKEAIRRLSRLLDAVS